MVSSLVGVFACLALGSPQTSVQPGSVREFLTFDIGGLIPIETWSSGSHELRVAVDAASKGDWKSAEKLFATIVEKEPQNYGARKGEADCAQRLGHTSALAARLDLVLRKAAAAHKPDVAALYERGILELPLAINKDPNKRRGSEVLGRAWFYGPQEWPVAIAYGDMCLALGSIPSARKALERAIHDNPGRRDFLPSYAYSLLAGSIGSAVYDAPSKRWIQETNPDGRREPVRALEILRGLMKTARGCATVYFLAGTAYELRADWDSASAAYTKYLAYKDSGDKARRRAEWISNMPVRRKLAHPPP